MALPLWNSKTTHATQLCFHPNDGVPLGICGSGHSSNINRKSRKITQKLQSGPRRDNPENYRKITEKLQTYRKCETTGSVTTTGSPPLHQQSQTTGLPCVAQVEESACACRGPCTTTTSTMTTIRGRRET